MVHKGGENVRLCEISNLISERQCILEVVLPEHQQSYETTISYSVLYESVLASTGYVDMA